MFFNRYDRSWAYQLQNWEGAFYNSHKSQFAVLEPFGTDSKYSSMATQAPHGPKRSLAYLSIGEAEDYRDYWPKVSKASYLDKENPDWPGNYKVKFWNHEWQSIIFSRVTEIMSRKWDGIYLDIIDAYEYYDNPDKMKDFVARIAQVARAKNPDALVIPQNGLALTEDRQYMKVISGVGTEDLFFGEKGDGRVNTPDSVRENARLIKNLSSYNKTVLSVEYGLTSAQADTYKKWLAENCPTGIPLVAERALEKFPKAIPA
jgi:uncharacterized protein (TIGR01370 family)